MIVIGLSDLHCGSSLGLWPPGMVDGEGGSLPQNPFQTWLWDRWQDMLIEIDILAEENPSEEIVAVVVGDIIQGSHEKDGQLTTTDPVLQALAAGVLLKLLRERVRRMWLLHGTGWHGGPASRYVKPAAEALDVVPNPATKSAFWWELYLQVGECLTHWTHHVSHTGRPQYEATAPLRDYYELEMELLRVYRHEAPGVRLSVRAHRHRCIRIVKPPAIDCLVLPGWQLRGEFVFKVGAAMLPDIGYAVIRDQGEGLTVTPRVYPLPPVHVER